MVVASAYILRPCPFRYFIVLLHEPSSNKPSLKHTVMLPEEVKADWSKVASSGFACFSNPGPEQCPRNGGQVNYADAVLRLVNPSRSLTTVKRDVSGALNIFEMTMSTAEAKPECRTLQSAVLVKDVWCTIQTARIDILIELKMPIRSMFDVLLPRVDRVSMAIPGAVLNVKLEEKLLENSDRSAHILQLAEVRIQNISSIIDDIKRSIPKAAFDDWRKWVLANTGMLLQQAVRQRGIEQCQW
ncbi:unnamed protein product [Dibothriocephalus latus]|uniref:Uncharacterized protein n=1 Tax=Dibothriocephalus latus TaxID=60516 RepID=A0A3P7M0M0_DIBLA|nr:unnamed protein product [Dibothriocephalus latus]